MKFLIWTIADVPRGAKRETFRDFKDLAQAQREHKAFQIFLRELEINYGMSLLKVNVVQFSCCVLRYGRG